MTTELDVLGVVSDRLSERGLPFMLTGSFALAYYATPRMTRDLDIVVALTESDVDALAGAFTADFYIDPDAARIAVQSERMFNLLHLESGVKVDLIVRKSSEYRRVEFERRKSVEIAGIRTWIVSREDLILSKLVWAQESDSELQRRDIRGLLAETVDLDYIREWAPQLGVAALLSELMP
jgi:predicted nucleotidyltransferase